MLQARAAGCLAALFSSADFFCGEQRAMGEFGAVSVISGNIIGRTQTLTLYVEASYKEYNTEAAFSAAVLLSFLAVGTLIVKDRIEGASET